MPTRALRRRLNTTAGTALFTALTLTLAAGCANSNTTVTTSASSPSEAPARPAGNFAIVDGEVTDVPDIEMGDPRTITRLARLATTDNRVMEHLEHLTQEIGARLTGSTSEEAAVDWAVKQFRSWGLEAREHAWGELAVRFDRGPSSGAVFTSADAENPVRDELDLTTLAWTYGTEGPTRGRAVRMPTTPEEFDAVSDQLEGAWVVVAPNYSDRRGVRSTGFLMRQRTEMRHELRTEGLDRALETADAPHPVGDLTSVPPVPVGATRWSGTFDYNGSKLPLYVDVTPGGPGDPPSIVHSIPGFHSGPAENVTTTNDGASMSYDWTHAMGASTITINIAGETATGVSAAASGARYAIELTQGMGDTAETDDQMDPQRAMRARVLAMDPAGFVSSSKDERVWTTARTGWKDTPLADVPTDVEVNLAGPDFDYINSRLADGAELWLEFDLQHTLTDGPFPIHQVIAEIPGALYPEQAVIVSGHLDSWDGPGSEGTVDNATGCSVVMEAARLLAESGAKPDRTIRFILWTGEEQGLLGARAYVAELSEEERANISATFVDDGGTGYEGGLPAADQMVDYLAAATAPTNGRFYAEGDGWLNVNVRPTGPRINTHSGSDHAAFNAVGIPGFFWDESGQQANYRYGWHTQFDRIDQAVPAYLEQSAFNMAVTAYNIASAPTLLPRAIPEEQTQSATR